MRLHCDFESNYQQKRYGDVNNTYRICYAVVIESFRIQCGIKFHLEKVLESLIVKTKLLKFLSIDSNLKNIT